jgi:hypothetical protein
MTRKTVLWIAAGLVMLAAIVVTVLLTVGGSTPTGVVDGWIKAASKGDLATVKRLSCQQLTERIDRQEVPLVDGKIPGYDDGVDLSGERIDGDKAEVVVTNRISLLKHRFHLVKESGWKVCDPFEIFFEH